MLKKQTTPGLQVGASLPALATLGLLSVVLVVLIAYEALRYADLRERVRHQPAGGGVPS